MIYFLKRLIFFLIIPVILILVLDQFHRNSTTLYDVKYDGLMASKDSVTQLILGNSHSTYGLNPNYFDVFTYNIANPKQSLYFDKRITLKLLGELPKLKYVLISIDYHSFYFSSQGPRNIWSYYTFNIPYKDRSFILESFSPSLFGYPPKVTISKIKRRLVNWYKYGELANPIYLQNGVNPLDSVQRGFIGYEGENKNSFTRSSYSERAKKLTKKYEAMEIVYSDLELFINELQRYNIEPILITPPTYSEFNSYLSKERIYTNNKAIDQLVSTYNLKYFNFMNSKFFQRRDFFDADHLNKEGAKKFSQILNDSLKENLPNYY